MAFALPSALIENSGLIAREGRNHKDLILAEAPSYSTLHALKLPGPLGQGLDRV
jgi:hypothetical protein